MPSVISTSQADGLGGSIQQAVPCSTWLCPVSTMCLEGYDLQYRSPGASYTRCGNVVADFYTLGNEFGTYL
jgi:hypothetical protein